MDSNHCYEKNVHVAKQLKNERTVSNNFGKNVTVNLLICYLFGFTPVTPNKQCCSELFPSLSYWCNTSHHNIIDLHFCTFGYGNRQSWHTKQQDA